MGLARRRRWPRVLADLRLDQLRQGSARAKRARVARRLARPLQERSGRSPPVNALDVARAALDAAGGEAEAVAQVESSGAARFAGSGAHHPPLLENAVVPLRVVTASGA